MYEASLERSYEMIHPPASSVPLAMAPPMQQNFSPSPGYHRPANQCMRSSGMPVGASCAGQSTERIEYAPPSLSVHPFRDAVTMNHMMRQQPESSAMLGAIHPGMNGHAQTGASMNLLGYPCVVGGVGSQMGGMPMPGNPVDNAGNEYQQKRRFVWTPDLHQRFEAACNQLGLDNAKPKSILRLMNVEGLTKANIKSHLQKYRCMMQKRSAADAGAGMQDGPLAKVQKRATKPSAGDESSDAAGDGTSERSTSVKSRFDDLCTVEGKVDIIPTNSPIALQRNLEVQEETLVAQMELQQQLTKQLQLQKRLQSEMETMMQSRSDGDEGDAASTKMNAILQMKQKLQLELQVRSLLLPPIHFLSQAPRRQLSATCIREACPDKVVSAFLIWLLQGMGGGLEGSCRPYLSSSPCVQNHMRMQHDLLTQLSRILPLGKSADSSSDDGNGDSALVKEGQVSAASTTAKPMF